MFPVLQIGPLALQTPGLILLAGLWLSLAAAEKFSPRFNTQPSILYNLTFISLLAGIVGARLAVFIQNPAPFLENPADILALSSRLLNLEAGLLVGLLAGLIYGQRKKLPFWQTLDAFTPGLAVLFISFGLANLASGDGFGAPTSLPWGIFQWGAVRHPSQVYEILAALLITYLTWFKIRSIGKSDPSLYKPGEAFLMFSGLSAGARLFLDAFRGDSPTISGNIHLAQVFSWIILVVVFWQLNRLKLNSTTKRKPCMTLKGKTILITGGARRIGRDLALAAAGAGADVIIHHGHSRQQALETAQQIQAGGTKAWVLEADLEKPAAAARLIDEAWEISPLYALVNNAAIFETLSFSATTIEAWQRHLAVNLTAPFLLSQAFTNRLGKENPGRIINLLDWRSLRPGADHFPYTISKAALAQLTASLAVALAPTITVNGLALGAVLPPADGGSPDILKSVPANRWASTEELQQAFLFLLDGPAYVTGEVIHLDGGRHLV